MTKTKIAALLSLLFFISVPLSARANHWPEPFGYLNGTAPRDPEFLPCLHNAVPGGECATQIDAQNHVSYRIVRKDGVIVLVVKVLLGGRVALTIYPPQGSTGK